MDTNKTKLWIVQILKALLCGVCLVSALLILLPAFFAGSEEGIAVSSESADVMSVFDEYMEDILSDAESSLLAVPKKFWIPEASQTIPQRNDSCYGTASRASELQWLIEEAAVLLDGQELLFSTDTEIYAGSKITYYLDESMVVICWQQVLDRIVYTIAEVKVSDASQFRRYMADGYYGSMGLYRTTELAAQAGAVVACSADHYRGRDYGIVVYDGDVKRFAGAERLDTCFVDKNGDLILMPRGTFQTQEALEEFIAERSIQFCFSFGPILIKDGQRSIPERYVLGEIGDGYPRCAIAQKDELHYLLMTANGNGRNYRYPTIAMLTDQIEKFGVKQAYTLDGGQTGAIVMQDKLMNPLEYKTGQRVVGDIFFFATAVPNHQTEKTGS